MANLRWNGDDFRNPQDSSGSTAGLISRSGDLQQGYSHGSLTQGLSVYIPFEGEDVKDATALNNDGIDNTSSGFSSGKVGSDSKVFVRTDSDYVEVPDAPSLNSDKITMALWLKGNDSDQESYSTPAGKGAPYIFERNGTSNEMRYGIEVGGTRYYAYQPNVFDGNWHHIAMTYDGKTLRAYDNGSLVDTNSSMSGPLNKQTGNYFSIGGNPNQVNFFDGSIDDVRIYDRALSRPEMKTLYNISKSSKVSPGDTIR